MLVLAHRPFPAPQPYAELGPLFLHAEVCQRYDAAAGVPAMFLRREAIPLRGYGADDRIVHGTGTVIATAEIETVDRPLFHSDDVSSIHHPPPHTHPHHSPPH